MLAAVAEFDVESLDPYALLFKDPTRSDSADTDAEDAHPLAQPWRPRQAYRGHVLIVDDEPDIREALRDLLTDEGYLPAEAENGQEALSALHASAESLIVLLDLRMPRVSGEDVLRAVAADPALAERHAFVLVTANTLPAQPAFAELLTALSVPIVRKPFSLDSVMRAIEQVERRFD